MYENTLTQMLSKNHIVQTCYLKDLTTFGIGGKATVLFPTNKKELIKCVKVCEKLGKKYQVFGNGSNILAKSSESKRIFITTRSMVPEFVLKRNSFVVSAGANLNQLILWCKTKGLSGLENLYGIPATVGGAIMTNAGAFGVSVFDYLEWIEVLDKGRVKKILAKDIEHSHHYTELLKSSKIVLSAGFKFIRLAPSVIHSKIREIIDLRKQKQPFEKSAGSVFQAVDGVAAGYIIDNLGLKGVSVGDACVSTKHANFIINRGNATDQDVKKLISIIKKEVKRKTNITLKREIEYIGERDEFYR